MGQLLLQSVNLLLFNVDNGIFSTQFGLLSADLLYFVIKNFLSLYFLLNSLSYLIGVILF